MTFKNCLKTLGASVEKRKFLSLELSGEGGNTLSNFELLWLQNGFNWMT